MEKSEKDIYARLSEKYAVPRSLVKTALYAFMYDNIKAPDERLEKAFVNIMKHYKR